MNHNRHFNKVIKISSYTIAVIFIVWFILSPIDTNSNSRSLGRALYSRFAVIIFCVGCFWLSYYKFFWRFRWPFFRRILFDQPDLSGTWMGYLKSDFLLDGEPLLPIKIAFFIRQPNFFDIRITSNSLSNAFFSFGEVLQFDSSNNMIRLLYQYSQKRTVPDSQDDQQGAADLFLYNDYMAGHYWTIVKTSGFIRVHKLSKKIYLSFEEADKELGQSSILENCYNTIKGVNLKSHL